MKKILCLLLCLAITAASVGVFSAGATTHAGYAIVTLNGVMGETVTRTYAVGDTITAYTYLNASAINEGKIGAVSGIQHYTDSVLELSEELIPDSDSFEDVEPIFPILSAGSCIANGRLSGKIKYNSGLISYKGFPFNSDESALIVVHYKVKAPGTAEITNEIVTMAQSDQGFTRIVNANGEIVDDRFTTPVALSEPVRPIRSDCTLSGDYLSFTDSDSVTVDLMQDGETILSSASQGMSGAFSFDSIMPGRYTLRVSKPSHVTRDYPVAVTGAITKDVKIHRPGDIDGDGKVNAKDYGMVSAHAQKVEFLTGYALACGDVVKNDGKITAPDAARISAHVQKTELMY